MTPRRCLFALLWALAALGGLGAWEPTHAHSPIGLASESVQEVEPASAGGLPDSLSGWALSKAPEMPGTPWSVLAGALTATTLVWWRPRRASALALVLLLAVFAFEDGLHSVHHGLDQAQASSCAMAAAGTHLSATGVDAAAQCDMILPVVALAAEPSPPDPMARFTSPNQGRAPPASLV